MLRQVQKRTYGTVRVHTGPSLETARQHCRALLQKYDYPSHLIHAFIPPRARDAHLAIRALNVDLAIIPDQVSQTAVGGMRYKFWREAVEKAFNGVPPDQPVAILLAHALQTTQMSRSFFHRMIKERENVLIQAPAPANLDALETRAENIYSPLLYLQLEALGLRELKLDHIVSHIGKSAGLATHLRGIPHSIAKGQVTLPVDIAARHDIIEEDLLRGQPNEETLGKLQEAVFEVATRANDHLITTRQMIKELDPALVNRDSRSVFLNMIPTTLWLEELESVNFDIFKPSLQTSKGVRLPWRLWRGSSSNSQF